MACQPPHQESLEGLRRLKAEVEQRGDSCLGLLIGGVDLYVSMGREWELLEIMRQFAHEVEDIVRNTPTAEQLKALYEREERGPSEHQRS